jgi:hypothetical protein
MIGTDNRSVKGPNIVTSRLKDIACYNKHLDDRKLVWFRIWGGVELQAIAAVQGRAGGRHGSLGREKCCLRYPLQ